MGRADADYRGPSVVFGGEVASESRLKETRTGHSEVISCLNSWTRQPTLLLFEHGQGRSYSIGDRLDWVGDWFD
jgi:hypothetical protein